MFAGKFRRWQEGHNTHWETRLAMQASGLAILDLTGSNPTTAGLDYPPGIPSLLNRPEALLYEPDPRGRLEARQAVAGYYASRNRQVRPEDLLLTASTSEAYSFLFKLLCDPGDEILVPSPTYPLFDSLAELEHVNIVRYPLRFGPPGSGAPRWRTDFGFLRSIVSTRSKALILVNPNNPTGHMADEEEMRAFLGFAADFGLALIVDEVFCDYALGERRFEAMKSDGPLVFTLNGFSKTLGLPQFKLAWIHAAGEASKAALERLEWIADAFLSVNTPVQSAAGNLLRLAVPIQAAITARLRANLDSAVILAAGSRNAGILVPEAGWYAVFEAKGAEDDEAFALRLLRERGVYALPGHLFGIEDGCRLVVSLLVPESDFREGFRRMLACAGEDADG